jgi:hypothetical protein
MRQSGDLARWMSSLLDPSSLGARRLFRPDAVARMLDEHRRRRHNHSHRMWTIAVLEAWLRSNVDVEAARQPLEAKSRPGVGDEPERDDSPSLVRVSSTKPGGASSRP